MSRLYWPQLVALSAIWGSSYLFIKVAVGHVAPSVVTDGRLLLAAPVLFAFVAARDGARAAAAAVWDARRVAATLGIVNIVIPYMLVAWGEQHVTSGVAAIANSSVPIFVALLALRYSASERVTGWRLVGLFVGLGGVAVLAGIRPEGGWRAVAGTLAVVLASLAYAGANLYAQRRIGAAGGTVLAAASVAVGAIVLLPVALVQLPAHAPGWRAAGSVLALGLVGTGLAQLIFYRMLGQHGASRATLVSYLIPVFALAYGIAVLGEGVTAPEGIGLALILAGVALGSGVVRMRGGAAAPQAP